MPQELRSTWSTEPSETQLVYCNASQCFTFYLASKNLAHLYSSHFKPVAARCSGGQARRGSELLSSKWSDFPNHARITPCCKLHSWSDLPGTTSVQVSSSCPARVDPCPWCQWPPLIASNYEVTNEIWKGDFALTGDMQFQDKLEQMFDAFSVHAFQYNFDTNSMTLGPTGRKKNANSSNSALQTRRAPVLRSRTRFTREKAPLFNLNHLREQSKWSNMGGTVLTRVLFARLIIPHKSHTYSFPSPAKMGIHMYWFPHVQLQILSQARSLWQPVAGGVWP